MMCTDNPPLEGGQSSRVECIGAMSLMCQFLDQPLHHSGTSFGIDDAKWNLARACLLVIAENHTVLDQAL